MLDLISATTKFQHKADWLHCDAIANILWMRIKCENVITIQNAH